MAECICGLGFVALTAGATFERGVHVLSHIYLSTYEAVVFVFRVSPCRDVLLCHLFFSQKQFGSCFSISGTDWKHVWHDNSAQLYSVFNGLDPETWLRRW